MFADGLTEMPHGHPPVVAHEPLHLPRANQFNQRHLVQLRERLDDVGTYIVHGTLLDEGLKEPGDLIETC